MISVVIIIISIIIIFVLPYIINVIDKRTFVPSGSACYSVDFLKKQLFSDLNI